MLPKIGQVLYTIFLQSCIIYILFKSYSMAEKVHVNNEKLSVGCASGDSLTWCKFWSKGRHFSINFFSLVKEKYKYMYIINICVNFHNHCSSRCVYFR